jgi:ADP-heptose:LPS heptosyltransferase
MESPLDFLPSPSSLLVPDRLRIQRIEIEKLVVFRALQLGDMLCAIPAFRALRTLFPRARITLVGLPWAEQFVRRFRHYIDDFLAFPGHPVFPEQPVQIDRIAPFYRTMRASRFDLALQMHGNGQVSNAVVLEFGAVKMAGFIPYGNSQPPSALFLTYPDAESEPVRLLKLAAHLGASDLDANLEFPLAEQDMQELHSTGLAAELTPNAYICIHPGARMRNKCWPPQRFAEVADALSDEFDLPIVLTGSANEIDLTTAVAARMIRPAINAAAPLSIGAMAALMNQACLLVCNDTGVSHIAAGLKLPSVVIFHTSDMRRWAPLNQALHRCVPDPEGKQTAAVLERARSLLVAAGR